MNLGVHDAQHLAPTSVEELSTVLREASESELMISVVGGGTHSGYGTRVPPDLVINMSGFADVEAWDPDDLTVTVGAGIRAHALEERLSQRSMTAVMPERPGMSTVGGVVAAGRSSLKRARLLGTRERVLEVTLVTGDGRVVRGGGRVVKNVSGFDLPRLVVGSFGALGVITSVCLKLWPVPSHSATLYVDDLGAAAAVRRPLAVLEDNVHKRIFLWGTREEVDASSERMGGQRVDGHDWPEDPTGRYRWSLRVPPAAVPQTLGAIPEAWQYLGIHGAGEVRAASPDLNGAQGVRSVAEALGGSLVLVDAPPGNEFEPWGAPPPGLDLQRRLIAQFDPIRVINRGTLPAGL